MKTTHTTPNDSGIEQKTRAQTVTDSFLEERFLKAMSLIHGKEVPQNYHAAGEILENILGLQPNHLPARYHYAMLLIRGWIGTESLRQGFLPFKKAEDEILRLGEEHQVSVALIAAARGIWDGLENSQFRILRSRGIDTYIHSSFALLLIQTTEQDPHLNPEQDPYQNTPEAAKAIQSYAKKSMGARNLRIAQAEVTKVWTWIMGKAGEQEKN